MIAIKGMEEMPSCCRHCPCSDDLQCNLTTQYNDLKGRPNNCPLVEIVTCKDCGHHEAIMAAKNTDGSEKIIHVCQKHGNIVSEDYYCADGTRKEDNYYIHSPGKDSNVVNGLPRSEEYFEERKTGNPDFCNG